MSSSRIRIRSALRVLLAATAVVGLLADGRAAGPRFYPDDPLWVDNDRAIDASGAKEIEASDYYDFIENTFFSPGDRRPIPAVNVNTLGEVPDSTWFENRIGRRPRTIEEIVRGPDTLTSLSVEGWPIVQGKNEGLQPGWRVADPSGRIYQIEFDPPSNPELATGAEMIGTAFYHAMGYHVVQVYLVEIDPDTLVLSPGATIKDVSGRRRTMRKSDIDWVLARAARGRDGKYRALASRFADGIPMGSFRYYGTRPDDPNDIFPHEHRRELRGNRVFSAWLNHDDSRGINSLVMMEEADGRKYLKHYMFDFGSIMGSGTARAQTPRAGNEYILDWSAGFATLATLGGYLRPWLLIDYPSVPPAVGNFEAEAFNPVAWKPEYPNPAFDLMQPEDAFWAARILSNFSDEAIQAVVRKARYSDPRATDYIAGTLIKRRDKVLQAWLTGVNPVVEASLSPAGVLTFENAAVKARLAAPPERYLIAWSRFDNATDTHEPVGPEMTVADARAEAPSGLLSGSEYIAATVRTVHSRYPHWSQPVQFYFRREGQGWKTVGLDRNGAPPPRQPGTPVAGR